MFVTMTIDFFYLILTLNLFYKQRFISNDFLTSLFWKILNNGLDFFWKIEQHWAKWTIIISNIKLREILQLPNNFEKKRTMKGWQTSQEIFFKMVDLSLVVIFVNNLMKSQLSTKYASFFFIKQQIC